MSNVDYAHDIIIILRDSDDFDLSMKGSIEDTIIQWSSLICKVLQEDPSAAFLNSQHPTPQAGKLENSTYVFVLLNGKIT